MMKEKTSQSPLVEKVEKLEKEQQTLNANFMNFIRNPPASMSEKARKAKIEQMGEQLQKNNLKLAELENQLAGDINYRVDYFRDNLRAFLVNDEGAITTENLPSKMIKDEGKLTRVFDAFGYPAPLLDIESLDPQALRTLIEEHLNALLPLILNEERTALNQELINALGNNYNTMIKDIGERNVALMFVQALVFSYGGRVSDKFNKLHSKEDLDNNPELKEKYKNFQIEIGKLTSETTLNGLSKSLNVTKEDVVKLQELIGEDPQKFSKHKAIMDNLGGAIDAFEMNMDALVQSKFIIAVEMIVENFPELPANFKPAEANWFKKFARWITNNENLFQSQDEKLYAKLIEIKSNITQALPQAKKVEQQSKEPQETQKPQTEPTVSTPLQDSIPTTTSDPAPIIYGKLPADPTSNYGSIPKPEIIYSTLPSALVEAKAQDTIAKTRDVKRDLKELLTKNDPDAQTTDDLSNTGPS
ncbi:MAG: hypothetical protein EPN84_07545 [Legionella sp.]|nr:MAG: hypothetical protein EPN84_07545 [Legionella sp.]